MTDAPAGLRVAGIGIGTTQTAETGLTETATEARTEIRTAATIAPGQGIVVDQREIAHGHLMLGITAAMIEGTEVEMSRAGTMIERGGTDVGTTTVKTEEVRLLHP